jgi:pimeloyl-ACP methyl ester carboxylesterase
MRYNNSVVTIILPGGSIHNKEWLEQTATKIGVEGEIRPVYWDHWTSPGKEFDPKEKARLADDVIGMRVVDIIAKSIGTLVAAYMIQKAPVKIYRVILNGIPLNDLDGNEKELIKSALRLIPAESILCIQNEDDPHGSLEEVREYLSTVNSGIKIIAKDRDDHEYPYQDVYRNFLLEYTT